MYVKISDEHHVRVYVEPTANILISIIYFVNRIYDFFIISRIIFLREVHFVNTETKNIALCGFMGCGKSTVAISCAKALGMPLADTDLLIEKQSNMNIPDIFREYGEEYFRKLEYDIIHDLCNGKNTFISLGGGAVLNKDCRDILKTSCITVFLDTPFESIIMRLKNDTSRPLILNKTPNEIHDLYLSRRDIYLSCADITVSGKSSPFITSSNIAREVKKLWRA